MIKLKTVKQKIAQLFSKNHIDIEEVNILLCEALKVDLSKLFTIENIGLFMYAKAMFFARQRVNGKPLNKIFKTSYFYGNKFYINNNVLAPRPETELLVENALKLLNENSNVLDLCTGSGCIAICIKKNKNVAVFASDVSKKALKVAKKNAKMLNAQISFIHSNLFQSIDNKFDMIVSNPPYISSKDIKNLDYEVKTFDPKIALDGGDDGLKFYRKIICDCREYLTNNGKILFEIGFNQAQQVKQLLEEQNFKTKVLKDYSNNDRIVIGEL